MTESIVSAVLFLISVLVAYLLCVGVSRLTKDTIPAMTTNYNGTVVNHFRDDETVTYDEDTLIKVRRVMLDSDLSLSVYQVTDLITSLQNEGILFRERAK